MKSTPALEAREAARFAGYTWEQYDALPGAAWWQGEQDRDNKAAVLVHYRTQNRLEAVVRDLEIKSMKKNGSKKK